MKKQLLTLAMFFAVGTMVFVSCKKDDTTAPAITLTGDKSVKIALNSAYTDKGATAKDDTDGDITSAITVEGSVNKDLVGTYTLTYTVKDKAGNVATETRTVEVYNESKDFAGTWSHIDTEGSSPAYAPENETITASTTVNNKIVFSKFAGFTNLAPGAIISGLTLSIASQQFSNVGTGGKTYTVVSTSGTIAANKTSFVINYTITEAGGTAVAWSSAYTKQ